MHPCREEAAKQREEIHATKPIAEGKRCRKCGIILTVENSNRKIQSKQGLICKTCRGVIGQQKREIRGAKPMPEGKQCRKCGISLTAENWNSGQQKRLHLICKACNAAEKQQWHEERASESIPQGSKCRKCGVVLIVDENWVRVSAERSHYQCNTCKAEYEKRPRALQRRRQIRMAVIEKYGGKCACCGESTIEFLAIDHINGGGSRERKTQSTSAFWYGLYTMPRRDDLRVLCHNCNMAFGSYGYCPHERERNGTTRPFDDVSDEVIVKSTSGRI